MVELDFPYVSAKARRTTLAASFCSSVGLAVSLLFHGSDTSSRACRCWRRPAKGHCSPRFRQSGGPCSALNLRPQLWTQGCRCPGTDTPWTARQCFRLHHKSASNPVPCQPRALSSENTSRPEGATAAPHDMIHRYGASRFMTVKPSAVTSSHLALLCMLLFLKMAPSWKKQHVGKVGCPFRTRRLQHCAAIVESRWPLDKLGCQLWYTCPSRTASCLDQKLQDATVAVLEVEVIRAKSQASNSLLAAGQQPRKLRACVQMLS